MSKLKIPTASLLSIENTASLFPIAAFVREKFNYICHFVEGVEAVWIAFESSIRLFTNRNWVTDLS